MKKKIALFITGLLMAVSANAQFEQGKVYVNANLSGFDFSHNGLMGSHFDIGAKGGYLISDNFSLLADINYTYYKDQFDKFNVGAGARYHISQNGLYLGAGVNLMVFEGTDVAPSVNVGYTFFLNKTVTIEPELYYRQSLVNHDDYSTVGFRIGIGIYFDELF